MLAPVELAPVIEGFTESTPLLSDPAGLRARAQEDGYLYFRNLIPRDVVMDLRRQFMGILQNFGWLRAGTDPMDGLADLDAVAKVDPKALAFCGVGVPLAAYQAVQRLEAFHAFAHQPELLDLYTSLFGEQVLVHPRHIARLMLPAPSFSATPAHQDFTHIQGTSSAWTCWVPIGDVPTALGGLSILAGSHQDGIYRYAAAAGAGGLESIICATDRVWHTSSVRAGDVLTFHSQTVHKGNPPQIPDRVRLSCDLRYQPAAQPIDPSSLKVHCDALPWEQIYAHWKSDRLKFYWARERIDLSKWDASLVQTHRKIC